MENQVSDEHQSDSTAKRLYRLGGVSALIAAGFALIQIIIEIIGVGIMRIEVPTTVMGWFILLQSHKLLGLTELTVFQIPAVAFCLPTFIALYLALKRTDNAYGLVATAFALLGMAVYLTSNTSLSLLSLSNQYASATTGAQRSVIMAAGQAMLAIYEGVGVDIGLFLFLVAILMISVKMLRSSLFSRITAYPGILAGAAALIYYISSNFTSMAIFIFEVAGALFVVWVALVGRRLVQLGYEESA